MGDLKPGWKRVKFAEVVRLCRDTCKDAAVEGIDRVIGLEHLEPGDLRVRSWADIADGTTFTQRVRPGQVLFGKRRAYQRKVAIADFDAICSGDIYVFESADPKRLLPELLPFLCQTDAFFEHAVGTSAGSLSPRTNWSSLAEYVFALPPLEEQRSLLELLSAINQLERCLREASIAASQVAMAGAVVALGVDAHRHSGALLEAIRIPRSWSLIQLRELSPREDQAVQIGPFGGTLASRHFSPSGVEVLKVQNIGHDGFIDRSDFVYVTEKYAAELERYRVRTSDVAVVAQGFTSGRVAIVREQDAGALISQHLIRVRLDATRVDPRWLWCLMRSALFQAQVAPNMMKSTRPGLNTEDILNLIVPLPPLCDQAVIADEIESLLAAPGHLQIRAHTLMQERCRIAQRAFVEETVR